MKLTLLTLVSASLLVCSTAVNALDMNPTFKDVLGHKNIVFGAAFGGSSHYNWVLSIGDELGQRGHNFSFLITSEDVRFGKPFVNVNTVNIGPSLTYDKVEFMRNMSNSKDMASFMASVVSSMSQYYERDYSSLLSYFEKNKVDVVLCDHFMDSCIEAAVTYKIPYIITATIDITTESAAPYINHELHSMEDPTTEFQGFLTRFKNKFIVPWTSLYKFLPHIKDMSARRKALGIKTKLESPSDTWKHSLKLVNSIFGYSAPRPVGPMSEFVGPIIPKQYEPLTNDLQEYLNAHRRLAFIAFGQNAVPTEDSIKLILTGLLESIEGGSLDGFLWATVHSGGFFPNTITTSSNITYNVQDMFQHINPHARMIKWAPQTAVLLHPSTTLFVSHGGLGSWYESIYSGTPMVMFPFFGDQPGNALTIQRSGLGGILKADSTVQEVIDLFKTITTDEGGEIKSNVKRMQALTQIHSTHSVLRGADMVEEVAYTHKNGRLPHRESADHRMTYVKSHNLDLYATLIVLVIGGLTLTIFTSFKVYSCFFGSSTSKHQPKVKKL